MGPIEGKDHTSKPSRNIGSLVRADGAVCRQIIGWVRSIIRVAERRDSGFVRHADGDGE